jgi:demethylmenaquinone methyltransferase / 2-methoxy-6-polyprenyl-1,4-benzoquinol methylase
MTENRNAADFTPGADDVFTRIARRYDFLCDIFSLGIHRYWKNHMAAKIAENCAGTVLDVASGTGDIPYRLIRKLQKLQKSLPTSLIVSDLCPAMISLARERLGTQHRQVAFKQYDGYKLDQIPDQSVDIYSISFAMKICDRHKIIAEVLRVLKPGGRFYCLEASRIPNAPLHWMYLQYMNWCLPLIARLATGGDRSAFLYLLKGIHVFPDQRGFASELTAAGFGNVAFENLSLGIVALHSAQKPSLGA